MKKLNLAFLFLATLFLATSCEETTVSEIAPASGNGITSLSSIKELIVFQYDFQNEATGERRGFIIDKHGALKSYAIENGRQGSKLPVGGSWTEEQISFLYNLSQTVVTIGEEEMLKYYNLSRKVYSFSLSPRTEVAGTDTFALFSFYKYKRVAEEQGGCGSAGAHSNEATAEYTVNVLDMEGAYLQENTAEGAKEITDWLKGLQVEAGL
ncbi:MAG TPA: hypothetical protein ENJ95_01645 [Bacteroidetes bacterium]|nr:hypothetical protein [Bacteroidota bacterium]